MKKFISTRALLIIVIIISFQTVNAQQSSSAFIEKLKKTEAVVILSDGSKASRNTTIVERKWEGDKCRMSVRNTSAKPVQIREVIVFDFSHGLDANTPIYGEGFQKLCQNGGTLANPEDWGSLSDRAHYKIPEPEGMRTSYGMLTLKINENDRVLLATTSCNRFISRFSFDAKRLRVSMDCENLTLRPGETWQLEEFIAIAGDNREVLYDKLTAAINLHHPRLKHDPVPVGWCSWYCFGPEVTAGNVKDNTDWIAANMPELKYIQIDDGYQPWMGDWLDAGTAFGGDVSKVLKQIKSKKLEPAIWVAPFVASPESKLFREHPDWMVKDENGQPLRADKRGFGGWRLGPWYVLDGTNPQVQQYFIHLFKTMHEQWGVTYFKLDANYWGAIFDGVHYDKNASRIEAYRRGMEAIRKGAGDAFLLGCNHPVWPSLGLIHGSRSSMDIERKWTSFRDIGRENMLRGWQNGRLWWNDPDCILLLDDKSKQTSASNTLTENEFLFHAAIVYASGGMLLSGDDLTKMTPERLDVLKKLLPPTGIPARFGSEKFEIGVQQLKNKTVYSVFNWGDTPVKRVISLPDGRYRLTDKWTGKLLGSFSGRYVVEKLEPHSALLIEAE